MISNSDLFACEITKAISEFSKQSDELFLQSIYWKYLERRALADDVKCWLREPPLARETILEGILSSREYKTSSGYLELLKKAADQYRETNNFAAVADIATELCQIAPTNHEYWALAGEYLWQNNQWELATQKYQEAHQLAPRDPEIGVSLAQLLFLLGKPAQGTGILVSALTYAPQSTLCLAMLSAVLDLSGLQDLQSKLRNEIGDLANRIAECEQVAKWLQNYKQAVSPESICSSVAAALAQLAANQQMDIVAFYALVRDPQEKINKLILASVANPRDHLNWVEQGYNYYLLNDLRRSELAYRQALHLQPNDLSIYEGLCHVLKEIKQYDELKWMAEKMLTIQPQNLFAAECLNLANAKLLLAPNHRLDSERLALNLASFFKFELDESKPKPTENLRILKEEISAHKLYLRSKPQLFNFEVTGSCNLVPPCVFCFSKDSTAVNYKKLNLDNLDAYREFFQNATNDTDCSFGEPLTHSGFLTLIDKVVQQDQSFGYSTNGVLLTPEKSDILLKHGRSIVTNISLNAATAETYHKLMGQDFNKTMDNVRYYCAQHKKMYGLPARVSGSFLLFKINQGELIDFVKLCAELEFYAVKVIRPYQEGTDFGTRNPFGYAFNYRDEILPYDECVRIGKEAQEYGKQLGIRVALQWLPDDGSFALMAEHNVPMPCLYPWKFITAARHDNTVIPCCFSEVIPEKTTNLTLSEVWNGDSLIKMRRALVDGQIPEFCQNHSKGCPLVLKSKSTKVVC